MLFETETDFYRVKVSGLIPSLTLVWKYLGVNLVDFGERFYPPELRFDAFETSFSERLYPPKLGLYRTSDLLTLLWHRMHIGHVEYCINCFTYEKSVHSRCFIISSRC